MARRPLVLVVLDGWGLSQDRRKNAIAIARTPTYSELVRRFPNASLIASGEAVGLPPGQMGNSEVGHTNIGAGRIVYQDLTRIDKSIADGDFFDNAVLAAAIDRCTDGAHALQFIGLVSDGGVHSHERHLHALIEMARRRKARRVFVHAFTDGRDTSPTGGQEYLARLQQVMDDTGVGQVASICGRYYAMDRDKRWDRTKRAYDAIVRGEGRRSSDVQAILAQSYAANITDEFVEPTVVVDADGQPVATVTDGDSVLCFNFRADRARQITRALAFDTFDGFDRVVHPKVHYTTMTEYDATYHLPVAFPPQSFSGNIAEVLTANGLTNLRLAETEKYAHVTYFFNCGEERPYRGEDRVLVPSPKVPTYDLKPEMSAAGITDTLVQDVAGAKHDVIICNFANADMVGHTGSLEAAVKAVETLDGCLARIVKAVEAVGGTLIVTADHGNAEQMWDFERNAPHTAHTSNPVPIVLADWGGRHPPLHAGALRDVAPTMIGLLGLTPPPDMTGRDLRDL